LIHWLARRKAFRDVTKGRSAFSESARTVSNWTGTVDAGRIEVLPSARVAR